MFGFRFMIWLHVDHVEVRDRCGEEEAATAPAAAMRSGVCVGWICGDEEMQMRRQLVQLLAFIACE